jgi:hypothetical protein
MTNSESLTSGMTALCSDLAFGIHAAAQPLAVLEASLGKEHIAGMTVAELRQLAAGSAVEVRRVNTIFHCLQQLVMAQSEPQLTPTPIAPLLTDAIDGVSLLFKDGRITLTTQMPESLPLVRIQASRTLHAVSRVLLVAHAVSHQGDHVELAVGRTGAAVQITVRNSKASPITVSPEVRLSLAIAAANIRSQHATFSQSLHPLEVHIDLAQASFAY